MLRLNQFRRPHAWLDTKNSIVTYVSNKKGSDLRRLIFRWYIYLFFAKGKRRSLPTHKRARRICLRWRNWSKNRPFLPNQPTDLCRVCVGVVGMHDLVTSTQPQGHKTKIVTARDQSIKRTLAGGKSKPTDDIDDMPKKPINMSDTKLRLRQATG